MKTIAYRCTELYIDCPNCKTNIEHIPAKEITEISPKNPEIVICPKCKNTIKITEIIS